MHCTHHTHRLAADLPNRAPPLLGNVCARQSIDASAPAHPVSLAQRVANPHGPGEGAIGLGGRRTRTRGSASGAQQHHIASGMTRCF